MPRSAEQLQPIEVSKNSYKKRELLAGITEFTAVKNTYLQTVLHLLDTDAMAGLSFDQKKILFIYSVWHHEPETKIKYVALGISQKIKEQAINIVLTNLHTRYERLEGMTQMIEEIQERTGKKPPIVEFDYWVYREWLTTGESPKTLAQKIPPEFDTKDLTTRQKKVKIYSSLVKLKRFSKIDSGIKQINVQLRQSHLARLIDKNGSLTIEELANQFEISKAIIVKDLARLRKQNMLPKGRNLTKEEKRAIADKILNAIAICQIDGRSYAKGDIGPAEIARAIDMDREFVNNFIKNNNNLLGLPQRQNPNQSRRSIREVYKLK